MTRAEIAPPRSWTERLYAPLPLPPVAVGGVAAVALLLLLAAIASVSGALDELAARGLGWWELREGRLAALIAVLAAVIPTVLRYHELGTRRNFEALANANLWHGEPPARLHGGSPSSQRAIAFGLSGVLLLPAIALSIDREPGLYFTADYWGPGQTWVWLVGSFVLFTGGVFTHCVYSDARAFAALARGLPQIDLLDRESLLPFGRQALRSTIPGVISVTFLALNLGDRDFLLAIVALGALMGAQNVAMLLIPLRGLHERLRAAKREELAAVNAVIRGDATALRSATLARSDYTLSDLLAWRRFVESVPEWPIDASTLGRVVFYVGIPLLSWVGAALVERVLDLAIGS